MVLRSGGARMGAKRKLNFDADLSDEEKRAVPSVAAQLEASLSADADRLRATYDFDFEADAPLPPQLRRSWDWELLPDPPAYLSQPIRPRRQPPPQEEPTTPPGVKTTATSTVHVPPTDPAPSADEQAPPVPPNENGEVSGEGGSGPEAPSA